MLVRIDNRHVIPDFDVGKTNVKNGMLPCFNHHCALDLGMYRLGGEWPSWQRRL